MITPNKPGGDTKEANFMRWVWEMLAGEGKLIDGPNMILCKTTRGRYYIPRPSQSSPAGATLDVFYYQSSMGDYIWCSNIKLPPAAGLVPKFTAIAKVPKLRNSVTSESIDGATVNYAYANYAAPGQKYLRRDASIPPSSLIEKQDINPRFITNDLIHAVKVTGGTGLKTDAADPKNIDSGVPQDILYIDMNLDARAWTQRDDQAT